MIEPVDFITLISVPFFSHQWSPVFNAMLGGILFGWFIYSESPWIEVLAEVL